MVFQTLNKLKWAGSLDKCEIVILHRGAPEDRKAIPGGKLTELKKTYFSYDSGREEVTIPLHRVLEVRLDGKTVWKRERNK
jgi:uncharacterized protein (UPF0248 family)